MRRKRFGGVAVAASAAAALAMTATGDAAVTAPHFMNIFPSRDFVHIEGYDPGEQVTVTVHHDAALIRSLSHPGLDASATGTVGDDGIFEINHVGATCWSGFTPDIRPGDTITVKDTASGQTLDSMMVQNVVGGRPIRTAPDTVEVHGTATNPDGSRPDVSVLGSRLINPTRFFTNGGKRNLNAPAVTYDDATSTKWTAIYAGLDPADMNTALTADTSASWTVTDAAATPLEGTAQETGGNAIAGPTTGCTAPGERVQIAGSETVPPSAPTNVVATVAVNKVTITWGASTDPVSTPAASGVQLYEVFRDAHDGQGPVAVATVQNPDGSNNPPTTFTDVNVPAGTYLYSVRATDAANNDSPAANAAADVTAVDQGAPPPAVTVSTPPATPHSIIGFPARDFISADGFTGATAVDVAVIRSGNIVATSEGITPQGATGLVEVNHPGGACWSGNTPSLQPGDILQTTAKDATGGVIAIDQTTIANVTAQRPVQTGPTSFEIHGTAVAPAGGQLPLDQIEQRLVTSTANAFAVNGKRTIRADSTGTQQGTLSYDSATSTRWTAKYTGLSAADVGRALGAESRALWLGSQPLVGSELTIFENGDAVAGGPSAPCTTPAAPQAKVALTDAAGTSLDSTTPVDLGSVDVVDQTKDRSVKTITLTNSGQQPLNVDQAYIAGVDNKSFTITRTTCDGKTIAAGSTCAVDVTFNPSTTGPTTASLNVADSAKIIGFQSVPLNGVGIAGKASPSVTTLAFNTVTAGAPVTKPVTVTNTGDAPLDVTPSITGAATADYTIAASNCTTLAPGAICTISVKFNPTAIGSRAATLEIPNDTGVNTRVALTGTGAGSTFVVSPNPVTFGTVTVNTTKTQTIGVRNSGSTLSFKVTAARITGDTTGAYTVPAGQACIGTTLAPGKSCNITVNLRPTAARFYTGTLEVSGDASSLPATVTTSLTGTGK